MRASADWAGAQAEPLAGDASTRRYWRLTRGDGQTAIRMTMADADDPSLTQFLRVQAALADRDLPVPQLYEVNGGTVVMEDLGPDMLSDAAARMPDREAGLYHEAIDLLVRLQNAEPPADLPRQSPATLAAAIEPIGWYLQDEDPMAFAALRDALRPALTMAFVGIAPVIVHRDFHADNLVWRPEGYAQGALALLDFQDALIGHPAYDLVSLVQDARRDLAPDLRAALIARYCTLTGTGPARFARDCAVMAAQRSLRILGIFARLARRDGKTRYLAHMPRVWKTLTDSLADPALAPLASAVARHLTPPDAP